MYKRQLGKKGENVAERYLKNKKYKIVCKNFYTRKGEIDIIAIKDNYLIFFEVKTRTNYEYGTPAMAVNHTKIKRMKFAAKVFLLLNKFNKYTIRFDVIEIVIKDSKYMINHIKQVV